MSGKYEDKKTDKKIDKTVDKATDKTKMPNIPVIAEIGYEQVKREHRLYFNIVKKRYYWFALSVLILLPGIISLFVQGLNLGIDFKGGSIFDIKFNQTVTQEKVTQALKNTGLEGSVQVSSGTNTALIRTSALSGEQRNKFLAEIEKQAGPFDRTQLKEDIVGPAIGAELTGNALKALAVASILILIYVAIRFEPVYAVAGVVALLHDIFITVGLFSLFQWQIDAPFIAAILTVFGYSINDTVVIYDRIRENEKRMKRKDSFEDMVDQSVWQTMGRSIKTVATVIISLLAIFFLGGESTKIFSLAMIIGVTSGAYSSIFNASQLVVEYMHRFGPDSTKRAAAQKS